MNEEVTKRAIILLLTDMTDEQLAEIVQEIPRLCLRNCPKNESPYCLGECLKELESNRNLKDLLVTLDMAKCLKCFGKKVEE